MRKKFLPFLTAAAMAMSLGTTVAWAADGNSVASIGEQSYDTLQGAITAIQNNNETGEIELTADTTENITIPAGVTVTIDLNGHTITNDSSAEELSHTITNNGTLTVMDSGTGGTVDNVSNGQAAICNNSDATATLDGGTYTRSKENESSSTESGGNSFYTIYNQGTMTLNAGVTVENSGTFSSCIINGGYENGAELTIDGATVTGGINAIKNDEYGSTLTIKSGIFENSAANGAVILNAATANINGGTFNGSGSFVVRAVQGRPNEGSEEWSNSTTSITDGTFNANGTDTELFIINDMVTPLKGSVFVSGGTFSESFSTNCLADDNVIVKENGSYVVEQDNGNYVARYSGVRYNSINDAIYDCPSEIEASMAQTIYICRNTNERVEILAGKRIQLDLNGHTITSDANTTVEVYGKLIIRDSQATSMIAAPTTNDTYTGGAIKNTSNYGASSAIYVSGGEVTVNSGIIDSNKNAAIALYNGATGNVRGGYLEAQECCVLVMKDATANISGGTLQSWDNAVVMGNGSSQDGEGVYNNTTINITGGKLISNITTDGYVACGIYQPQKGTLNITGGEIIVNGGAGVVIRGGDVNIGGNAVIKTTGTTTGKVGDSRVVVPCSAIVYDSEAGYYDNDNVSVNVTGGTFTSYAESITVVKGENDTEADSRVSVSGGTYTSDVTDYLTPTAGISDGTNNTYTVISPDSPTSTAGTYKTKTVDGTYEQMRLFNETFDTATDVSSMAFSIKENNGQTYTYNYTGSTTIAEGSSAVFGLIVTDIPEDTELTIELAESSN